MTVLINLEKNVFRTCENIKFVLVAWPYKLVKNHDTKSNKLLAPKIINEVIKLSP